MSENIRTKLPEWFKVPAPGGPNYSQLKRLMRTAALHTVCEEAHCPNIGDCWERKSATFMILGDVCTRHCLYCAVTSGKPRGLDIREPARLARTVRDMGLKYCVITSVNRDDLSDGGAFIFAMCIKKIRESLPDCRVEVLIPDFDGSDVGLRRVVEARPDVLNHNIESTKRIFPLVRPRGDYQRSLSLLATAKTLNPSMPTKSGIIVGMGEDLAEVEITMRDLRAVGCDLLTIGQYLRPSIKHIPIARFYKPNEFEELRVLGEALGFKHVASGPLVRSSYHADEQYTLARTVGNPTE